VSFNRARSEAFSLLDQQIYSTTGVLGDLLSDSLMMKSMESATGAKKAKGSAVDAHQKSQAVPYPP
jgi:hypothetical protein